VLPLVEPLVAPLWSVPVLLGVVEVLGVVTDWLPFGEAELMPEFAGLAELFGLVDVSGCVLVVPCVPIVDWSVVPVEDVPVVLEPVVPVWSVVLGVVV